MRHKRSTPNRSNRVADQIQRDVAELIRDLKDPRIGMVTINSVEVTPDYAHAKVFFSILIGKPEECEEGLNEAAGYIRNGLFKRLQIHTVPTLHFHFDRTTERAAELSALINRAVADKAKDADQPPSAGDKASDTTVDTAQSSGDDAEGSTDGQRGERGEGA